MQRGFMDPLDKLLSLLIEKLILALKSPEEEVVDGVWERRMCMSSHIKVLLGFNQKPLYRMEYMKIFLRKLCSLIIEEV